MRDYADQPGPVAAARARLATAGGAAKPQTDGLTPRRVIAGSTGPIVDISADGRFALIGGGQVRRLQVQDMLTNQTRTLVAASATAGSNLGVFSGDGQQVAYVWRDELTTDGAQPGFRRSIRVIGTGTGAVARTLIGPTTVGGVFRPEAWSPDGRTILMSVTTPTEQGGLSLSWISATDGHTIRTVKSFEPWRGVLMGLGPRLSPDGASIAFSAIAREGSADRYIYLMDADGQNEAAVVKLAGVNANPVWTPDSSHLLFTSSRSGSSDLFVVNVRTGGAMGEPVRVQSGFGGQLSRVSRSGDLFYSQPGPGGIYEVIAERNSGAARVVQAFRGQSGMWSKQNQLALFKTDTDTSELIVRSLETGEERSYPRAGMSRVSPRWLGDGSGFILWVPAAGDNGRPGGSYYLVDVKAGTFKWLFARHTQEHERFSPGVLSPDDKTLYLAVRKPGTTPYTGIVGVDISTGVERPVVTFPGRGVQYDAPGLAISPDGATLAIVASFDSPQEGRIVTVQTDGTGYRELHGPIPGGLWADMIRWTPDGQSILFVSGRGSEGGWKLMRISATGGQPEFDGLDSKKLDDSVPLPELGNGVFNFDLSPDGSKVVFSAPVLATRDVWTIENIMSALQRR